MSLLHGDVEAFVDGVCDRVMWGVFSRPDRAWLCAELHADEESAVYNATQQYDCPTIVQTVKVRIDLRGAQ